MKRKSKSWSARWLITSLCCAITISLFSSCCTSKPIERITETRVEIKEVIRDTTVFIPADKATAKALLECDSLGNIRLKQLETLQGKLNAKTTINVKDNVVMVDCNCDSTRIYLQLKERYETVNTSQNHIITVEKELAWWQITLMWTGAIAIILCLLILIIRFKNTQL